MPGDTRTRYTRTQWERARNDYCYTTKTVAQISRDTGIPEAAILMRKKRYPAKWPRLERGCRDALAKEAGTVAAVVECEAIARQAVENIAIDDVQDQANGVKRVIIQHRLEWEPVATILKEAMDSRELEVAKFAKTVIEATAMKQKAERAAWSIAEVADRNTADAGNDLPPELKALIDKSLTRDFGRVKVTTTTEVVRDEKVINAEVSA